MAQHIAHLTHMLPMGTLLCQGREESEIVTVVGVKHARAHLSIKLGNSTI